MVSDQWKLLLNRVKLEQTVAYNRLYLTYQHGKYTVFLDKRTVLQTDCKKITYNLYSRQAARVAKDVLEILIPEAKIVYPYIMIGDIVC